MNSLNFLPIAIFALKPWIAKPTVTKNKTRRISINGLIEIPTENHIATMREHFLTYCEDRNLDATLEPYRMMPSVTCL